MSWLPGTKLTSCGEPSALKPIAPLPKFRGKGDIGDIAGNSDVVWRLRLDVGDNRRERFRVMNETTFLLPVEIAGHAFADQLAPAAAVGSGARCGSERWASVNIVFVVGAMPTEGITLSGSPELALRVAE